MKKRLAIMLVSAALLGSSVASPAAAQNGQQGGDGQHEGKRPVGPIVREDKGGNKGGGGDRQRDRDRGGRDGGGGGDHQGGGKRDKPPKNPNFD